MAYTYAHVSYYIVDGYCAPPRYVLVFDSCGRTIHTPRGARTVQDIFRADPAPPPSPKHAIVTLETATATDLTPSRPKTMDRETLSGKRWTRHV